MHESLERLPAARFATSCRCSAERIDPNVVTALDELGIDLGQEFPKPLTDEVVRAADAVVTMGCGDARAAVLLEELAAEPVGR